MWPSRRFDPAERHPVLREPVPAARCTGRSAFALYRSRQQGVGPGGYACSTRFPTICPAPGLPRAVEAGYPRRSMQQLKRHAVLARLQ